MVNCTDLWIGNHVIWEPWGQGFNSRWYRFFYTSPDQILVLSLSLTARILQSPCGLAWTHGGVNYWWWPYHIFSKDSLQMTKSLSQLNSHWKMMPGDDQIIYFQKIVSRWQNHCHDWICTEKWCITCIYTYKTKKLPNMASLITTWTPPLNSHKKTGPGHISCVPSE